MSRGRLYYRMSASEVGKHGRMRSSRVRRPHDAVVVLTGCYATRPRAGGAHDAARTSAVFRQPGRPGRFAMCRRGHGLQDGIGTEIRRRSTHGLDVVVKGSRGYLEAASRIFENLVPELVEADITVLRDRRVAQGREDADIIVPRLGCAAELVARLIRPAGTRVDNGSALEHAGA